MAIPRLRPNNRGAARTIPTWAFLLGIVVSNLLIVLRFGLLADPDDRPAVMSSSAASVSSSSTPKHTTDIQSTATTVSYDLARKQSYGFFQDIADDEWKMFYQTPALARSGLHHYVNQTHPNERSENPAWWIFQNWDPVFSCKHLVKVGGLGDGPKFTCDPERILSSSTKKSEDCLVYSIGSNGDYRFEYGLYEILGSACEIHIFDPGDYDHADLKAKNMHFHQWGLISSYTNAYRGSARTKAGTGAYYSFPEIQQRLGHVERKIDIFKIDCEGCEWYTFKDWIGANIQQILIETHDLPVATERKHTLTATGVFPQMHASEYFDAFEQNGFVLYSKEVNSAWGKGKSSEWSYLKLHPDFWAGRG